MMQQGLRISSRSRAEGGKQDRILENYPKPVLLPPTRMFPHWKDAEYWNRFRRLQSRANDSALFLNGPVCKQINQFLSQQRGQCIAVVVNNTCSERLEDLVNSAQVPEATEDISQFTQGLTYVGCFSSDYVEKYPDYYKIEPSVPWKHGKNTCLLRLTTYLAVTDDESSSGSHTFFCGNDITEHSKPVNQSRCQKCSQDDPRYCGDSGAIAVYKLRGYPLSVYVGVSEKTTSSIKQVFDVGVNLTLQQFDTAMWDMNYVYGEDAFWYTDSNITYRYVTRMNNTKFGLEKQMTVSACGLKTRSPSVDWLNKKVYIGCSEDRKIHELDFEGNLIKTYDTKLDKDIHSMSMDPYRRIIFLLTNGERLHAYYLDTGVTFLYTRWYMGKWFKADAMCIDTHNQNIYIVGELRNDLHKSLLKKDYRDVGAELIYQGPELENVLAMDYYNGTIVWTSKDSLSILHKCKLSPTCKKEDLKKIYSKSTDETFVDVKFLHPLKQSPDTAGLCSELGCSHTCTRVSLFEAKCECPSTLTLMEDQKTCAEYVGCFTSGFAESHPYYKLKNSLMWNQGKAACANRLTTHMAVSADPSSLGNYKFFCGNDLVEHSEPVNLFRCLKCHDHDSTFCGGRGLVSIYRLRDSTPFSVLVSVTRTDVLKITEEYGVHVVQTMVPLSNYSWDLSYFYKEDEIWLTSKTGTFGSTYNELLSRYTAPILVPTCKKEVRSPVMDWVNNKVFYACAAEKTIQEVDLKGNVLKSHELSLSRYINQLALDPYKKLLFVSTWGNELYTYALETSTLTKFSLELKNLSLKGKVFTFDHQEKNLYIVGTIDVGVKGITAEGVVRVNYENKEEEILYKGYEVKNVYGIDYFNGTLVWSRNFPKDNSNVRFDMVYKCKLSPKCKKEDIKVLYSDLNTDPVDVKIYHPLKQTPDTASLCSELGCSHTCTRVSLFHAKCKCPSASTLQSDRRTCSEEALQLNYIAPSDKVPRWDF